MPPHNLTNLEIQKLFNNETRFNSVYSYDDLPDKIKDNAYVINHDEYADIDNYWIALYVNNDAVTYFDSFGVKHIPKEIKSLTGESTVSTNIFRIQTYDSVMCWYFCIRFIGFMLKSSISTKQF